MKQAGGRVRAMEEGIFAIVDTETTNASPSYGRVIEVGVLRVERGKVTATFQSLVNPERPIQPGVEAVTGIKATDLENAPRFSAIARPLLEILQGAILVAHNAKFDYAFLRHEFARARKDFTARTLDTVALSKHLFPDFHHHDLSSLIARHHLSCPRRHRAFDDAAAVWGFLKEVERTEGVPALTRALGKCTGVSVPAHMERSAISALPDGPGVYLFYGKQGELLYIGKSNHIRRRVQSHFAGAAESGKEFALFQQTAQIEARTTVGELGALLLEASLIKQLHPIHNRAARAHRPLAVVVQHMSAEGYATLAMEEREALDPADLAGVVTVFKSRMQARAYLTQIGREHELCDKLLGLERPGGACFPYHLHRCKGACVGEESPALYNARLLAATEDRRIQTWPFRSGVLIRESGEQEGAGEAFLVHQWCLLSSVSFGADGAKDVKPGFARFDFDSYKILARFLRNPRNRRMIKTLSDTEFRSILAELSPSTVD